jgi:hypothetical protein
VADQHQANMLIGEIHKNFEQYSANFDLDDCDNILRVRASSPEINSLPLIQLLNSLGFTAEVLP